MDCCLEMAKIKNNSNENVALGDFLSLTTHPDDDCVFA